MTIATVEDLRLKKEAAAADLDFEGARKLRDRISLMHAGADPDEAARAADVGLTRQKLGAMGLGSSRQSVEPPEGWKPPRKPDLYVTGSHQRHGRFTTKHSERRAGQSAHEANGPVRGD